MKNKSVVVACIYFFVFITMTYCMNASLQSDNCKFQDSRSLHTTLHQEKTLSLEEQIVEYSDEAFQSFVTCWGYKQAEILKNNKDEHLFRDFYQQLPEDIQNAPWMQRCLEKKLEPLGSKPSSLSLQSMSSITDENISETDFTQSTDTFIQEYDVIEQQEVCNKGISCGMGLHEIQDCIKTPVVSGKKNSKKNQQLALQAEQEAQKLAKKAKEKLRQDAKNARRKAAKIAEQEKQEAEELFLKETACIVALECKIKDFDEKYMHQNKSKNKYILHTDKKIALSSAQLHVEASIENLLWTMIKDLEIEQGGYNAYDDENFLDQYNDLYSLLQQLKHFDCHINSSISLYLEMLDIKIKKGIELFDNDDDGLDYDFYYDNNKKFTIIKNLLKITKTS